MACRSAFFNLRNSSKIRKISTLHDSEKLLKQLLPPGWTIVIHSYQDVHIILWGDSSSSKIQIASSITLTGVDKRDHMIPAGFSSLTAHYIKNCLWNPPPDLQGPQRSSSILSGGANGNIPTQQNAQVRFPGTVGWLPLHFESRVKPSSLRKHCKFIYIKKLETKQKKLCWK